MQSVGGAVASVTGIQPDSGPLAGVIGTVIPLIGPADLGGVTRSLQAGNASAGRMAAALAASALMLSARGAASDHAPAQPDTPLPRLPGGPGTGATGSAGASGIGGAAGGMQGGVGAALIALLMLLLLRLARRATLLPIWRCYLPEVPPA